jgi:succinyl-CoA synthetase beta subunit
MNLHEYQARELLAESGIPIPEGLLVVQREEAQKAIANLKLESAVVKAQVHAGGRGKAGGVKVARSPSEILREVERMLGMRLITGQTGPQGVPVNQVLLTRLVDIEKEYY